MISPSFKRDALVINRVRVKFLVELSISVMTKDTTAKFFGSVTSAAVSPTDINFLVTALLAEGKLHKPYK